jgi:hypothetical protein
MKKLLQFIVENIVKNPKSVKIEQERRENNWLILHLTVHPTDMGQVIGKEGKIIKALRNVLRIKAIKNNIHFSLELRETS